MADLIGITGNDGFLGNHVVEKLKQKGFEVRVFNRELFDLFDFESLKKFVKDAITSCIWQE